MKNKLFKVISLILVSTTILGCGGTQPSTPSSSSQTNSIISKDDFISSSEEIIKHTVTFVADNDVIETIEIEDNEIIKELPSLPEKNGYSGSWDYDFTPIKNDTVIHANYELLTYNIYYHTDYGDVNPLNPITYTHESENLALYTPLNGEGVGKYFLGWYTTPTFENGTKISHIQSGSYGDIHLYAKWIACVVEYAEGFVVDYNTESLPTLSMVVKNSRTIVTLSSMITVSPNCTWTLSYDIEGIQDIRTKNVSVNDIGHNYYYLTVWYDENYNLVYLVDIYKLDMYSYAFISDNTIYVEETPVEETALIGRPDNPSKTGYTFIGWTVDGTSVVEFPYKAVAPVVFYALFTPNEYTISLDYDNENYENEKINTTYDSLISLPQPTKYGHTFTGWVHYGTNEYQESNFIYNYENSISLVATYVPNDYHIHFDLDNDGDYDDVEEITFGNSCIIEDASWDGHTFTGWTDNNGNVVDGTNYTHNYEGDVYINANWDINVYSIKYDLCGGDNSSENPNSYTYEDSFEFKNASKTGYRFNGWYLDELYQERIYEVEYGSFGDLHLYASFTPNIYEYKINYENGDVVVNSVYYDSTFIIPQAQSRTGYTFINWVDQYGNEYNPNEELTWNFTYNIELTPVFEINTYEVTLLTSDENAATLSGAGTYEYNQTVTISASLNDGYAFMGWFDSNDNLVSNKETYSFVIGLNDITYKAKFYYLDNEGNYIIDGIKYKDNGSNFSVVGYTSSISNEVNILSTFLGKNIVSIEDNAFKDCNSLTSIVIPNSVTSIGSSAFENCSSLTTIEIPNSVTSVGDSAFRNCSSLTSIVIPNSVTSIGSSAFRGCCSLESITLPFVGASATSTGSEALFGYIFGTSSYTGGTATKQYYNSSSYVTYYIPSSLKEVIITGGTTISYGAFYNCSSLTSIVIPNSVTSIGNYAFEYCSSLTSITIPNSVKSIGNYAFYNSSSLTNVYYLGSIEEWCNITFSSTTSNPMYYASHFYMLDENNEWYEVTSLEIPSTITSIGNYQFSGFDNVTEIIIPNSVTSIGNYAFYKCGSLTRVTFEEGSQLTSIGNSAFEYCVSLTTIVISNNVTNIGSYSFRYCSLLTIYCEAESQPSEWDSNWNSSNRPVYWGINENNFIEINGIQYVIENGEAKVIKYVGNDSEVVIPSTIEINGTTYNVTSIGEKAFSYCDSLTSIVIPNTITSIGESAFFYCSSLTTVTFEEGSQLISIGDSAFYNCSSLTSIIIPNSVTSIGSYAFYDCDSLTIYCEASSKPSGWDSDWNSSDWNSSSRPVYWGIISEDIIEQNGIQYFIKDGEAIVTRYVGNDSEVVIPSTIEINGTTYNVTSIGNSAFSNCDTLTSIVIPDSVTSIGDRAFYNCDFLTIYCEASSRPSDWAYYWNYDNRPVYWGINENTFVEINGVQYVIVNGEAIVTDYVGNHSEVVIPSTIEINGTTYNVTSIGEKAFSYCDSLTSIVIPNTITSIGSYAFCNCSSLTTVTFEDDSQLTSIGNSAFSSCSSLTSIVIPNSVISIGDSAFSRCSSLTSITIPNSVTSIGSSAFYDCNSLISVYYSGTIEEWCNITFSSTTSNPMYYAEHFYMLDENNEWYEVTSLEIPSTITSIGKYQFCGFDNVTEIIIPNSVTSIGEYAFYDCDSLESITVPFVGQNADGSGATHFGYIFGASSYSSNSSYVPSSLKEVTITGGTSIADHAFYDCDSLTSIVIPNSVTSIGEYAFRYCYSLTIYCEASSKPSGWDSNWNSSNRPVVWGYKS